KERLCAAMTTVDSVQVGTAPGGTPRTAPSRAQQPRWNLLWMQYSLQRDFGARKYQSKALNIPPAQIPAKSIMPSTRTKAAAKSSKLANAIGPVMPPREVRRFTIALANTVRLARVPVVIDVPSAMA